MITKLWHTEADGTDPYRNLAREEYLTMHTEPGECILYLWQNRHTVVIGKNQNCWKECKINFLEEEGGFLARRLSGGGAVFHDLGNLNFTFCVRKEDYDLQKQTGVILEAVRKLGVQAERSGRNDITADGRKFSGNAFFESNGHCYHHGTLLVNVDKDAMSRYLNVDKEKLRTKSVESVRARVANLSEFVPDITLEKLRAALLEAFGEVYGQTVSALSKDRTDENVITERAGYFASPAWKYGHRIPFDYEMSRRFAWGGAELQFRVEQGKIASVNVFSDAMDQAYISQIPERLTGIPYQEAAMFEAISGIPEKNEQRLQMEADLRILIHESL